MMNANVLNMASIAHALLSFEPLGLADIQEAALLDRVDTKYVFAVNELPSLLAEMTAAYRVLTIDEARLHTYRTLYFDTDDFSIYEQHHNGFGSRYKVRARKYVGTDTAFFEIKHRTNQKRTIKTRLPIADVDLALSKQAAVFLQANTPFDAERLAPKLWNDYQRVTLVSKGRPERVTLDVNLEYHWEDASIALPGVVIAEVKQDRLSYESPFIMHMRHMGIRPLSYSKYTAGVYSLYEHVKANNFKVQIRRINQLTQGISQHEWAS
ncbi:MAG: polyphosphate polymerase domain-containing protein [Anaerolineae bacterium]|nr:polyphosphate polymerase domain-containing protein [Anaerolineae bacterium]